jgi:protein-tyrosine-phosphatase
MYCEDLLVNHRIALLTPTIVEEADLILVMDDMLLKGLPAAKTFVLKPYFGLKGNITDPWPDGQDEATAARYARCGKELREILEGNIDMIIKALRPR